MIRSGVRTAAIAVTLQHAALIVPASIRSK
jgi:hypothetical protein